MAFPINRPHARILAPAPRRGLAAATRAGAYAAPLLALLLATCESALVVVAERILNAAGATSLLP